MSVNVYDVAYELEKGIKESNEYIELKKLYEAVNKDEVAKKMFDNFREMQMKLQQKQMMGQEITQEEVDHAQKLLQLVQQNDTISKLIAAEQRMSMLVAELNKIIMKPLEELYGPMMQ
ncbi:MULTISPECIES: YlbF family regulator [Bacillus]|uniref:YlbF family regulator n=1 Tax=Bacillus TaxID=1386 RepID=UPI000307E8E1|nr:MULTISPECIES: YlbF family regulator [Bacillus]